MPKKPWSKLQRELYDLLADDVNFQIHCVAYPMRSQYGSSDLPRYWITLDKETIFDYPKDFVTKDGFTKSLAPGIDKHYPYNTDIPDISALLREYIDTPKEELFGKHFANDKWGLINILKAADRRIGIRRLDALRRKTRNIAAGKVIARRLEKTERPAPENAPDADQT